MKFKIGNTDAIIADTSISLVKRSPFFLDEENNGSYLFNFSVHLTPDLKKELYYPNRPGSKYKQLQRQATLNHKGLEFKGTATLTAVSETKIEVYLPAANGQLADRQKIYTLQDLDLGADIPTHEVFSEGRIFAINNSGWWKFYIFAVGRKTDGPLPFMATEDPDGHWIDSTRFVAQKAGTHTVIFNLNLAVLWGKDFALEIHKNGTKFLEKQIDLKYPPLFSPLNPEKPATGYFVENGSTVMELTLNLNVFDSISFHISANIELGGGNTGSLSYGLRPSTSFGIYHKDLIQENTNKSYPETSYATFPVYNPSFYQEAPRQRFLIGDKALPDINEKIPVINYHESGVFPRTITRLHDEITYSIHNTIVPFPFIANIIKAILKKTNTVIIGDNPFEQTELARACLITMTAINRYTNNAFGSIPSKFNLKDQMPPANMARFFADICITLGIAFDYNEKENTIQFVNLEAVFEDKSSVEFSENITTFPTLKTDLYQGYKVDFEPPQCAFYRDNAKPLSEVNLKGEIANLTDLPAWNNKTNDCYFVTTEKAYYYYNYDTEKEAMGWIYFGGLFQPTIISDNLGTEEKAFEYTLPITPLINFNKSLDPTYQQTLRSIKLPAADTPGKMEGLKPVQEQEYRIAFYHGLAYDGFGYLYPKGSSDQPSTPLGVPLEGHISLHLTTDNASLFGKRLGQYINWRTNTPGVYTISKMLKPEELRELNLLKWHNILGVDYIIKEIRASLENRSLISSEIDLVSRNQLLPEPPPQEEPDIYAAIDGNTFFWQGKQYTVIVKDGLAWLDRNLGADKVADHASDQNAFGDYYQWGRLTDGHEKFPNSGRVTELSPDDEPGHDFFICGVPDWRSPSNDNLWQGPDGINNPCPPGWRLPTQTEFDNERLTWIQNSNYGAINSVLRFPCNGYRNRSASVCNNRSQVGSQGHLWTSTIQPSGRARYLMFNASTASTTQTTQRDRAFAGAIRPVRDLEP